MTESIELRDPRVYELSFLLMPTIAEDEVQGHVDALKKIITDNGGLPIADGDVEFIDLAYEMRISVDNVWNKFNQAYFGWMKFDVTPEKIEILNELLSDYDDLIRYLLISSDRDVESARPRLLPTQKASRTDMTEESEDETTTSEESQDEAPAEVAVNEDELDKHIDEMVADESATTDEDTASQEDADTDTSENNE